jgi:[citrate (pro-3S)-lyase] ligase
MQKLCDSRGVTLLVFNHANVSMLENAKENNSVHISGVCYRAGALVLDFHKQCEQKNIFIGMLTASGIRNFDLKDCLNGIDISIFTDHTHVNAQGNALIAKYMYDAVVSRKTYDISAEYAQCIRQAHDISVTYAECIRHTCAKLRNITLSSVENEQWLERIPRIRAHDAELVGAIVMNCNPFTLGHKHIIAESLKRVHKLYIFVVEEDKSYFSFAARYAMVRDGVREFGSRVCVVPSGTFILSSTTFPDYFCKDVISYEPDARTDIMIFCSTVAPALGIQVRLFGEEPYCKVTAAYHKQLSELIRICGFLPIQIPRLAVRGTGISASSVRRLLAEGQFSQLARLVPPTTMPYVINKVHSATVETARHVA